jgi:hypothetical protein
MNGNKLMGDAVLFAADVPSAAPAKKPTQWPYQVAQTISLESNSSGGVKLRRAASRSPPRSGASYASEGRNRTDTARRVCTFSPENHNQK